MSVAELCHDLALDNYNNGANRRKLFDAIMFSYVDTVDECTDRWTDRTTVEYTALMHFVVKFHLFADDKQAYMYVSDHVSDANAIRQQLSDCATECEVLQ